MKTPEHHVFIIMRPSILYCENVHRWSGKMKSGRARTVFVVCGFEEVRFRR